jgi:hypothetical protein
MDNHIILQHRFGSLFSKRHLPGDASQIAILHIVNNGGVWEGETCWELSQKWPVELGEASPEYCYRQWAAGQLGGRPFGLGMVLSTLTPEGALVLSLVGAKGSPIDKRITVRYAALVDGLRSVVRDLRGGSRAVHVDWEYLPRCDASVVATLLEEVLVGNGVSVVLFS